MEGSNMKYFFMVLAIVVCSFVQQADNQAQSSTPSSPNTFFTTPSTGFTVSTSTPSFIGSTTGTTGTTGTTTTTTTNNPQCMSALTTLYTSYFYIEFQSLYFAVCFRLVGTSLVGNAIYFETNSRTYREKAVHTLDMMARLNYPVTTLSVSPVQQTSCKNPPDAYSTMYNLLVTVRKQQENAITLFSTTCKDSSVVLEIQKQLLPTRGDLEELNRNYIYLSNVAGDKGVTYYEFDRDLFLKLTGTTQACAPSPSQAVLYQYVPKVRTILIDYTNLEYAKCGCGSTTGQGYGPGPGSSCGPYCGC